MEREAITLEEQIEVSRREKEKLIQEIVDTEYAFYILFLFVIS